MSVAIVHLSDIHATTKATAQALKARMDRVPRLLNEFAPKAEGVVVVISGDIANEGLQTEYWGVLELLQGLVDGLKSLGKGLPVQVVCVPGNHDCDFQRGSTARASVIERMLQKPDAEIDTESVAVCTAVQEAYFEFQDAISDGAGNLGPRILMTRKEIELGPRRLRFHLFNTAWMSQITERQGDLLFPTPRPSTEDVSVDFEVSVMHHPYAWLRAEHSRALKEYVAAHSRLVLTGHEHSPTQEARVAPDGDAQEYLEGGVLYNPDDTASSSVNIVGVDLDENCLVSVTFTWDGANFREKARWQPPVCAARPAAVRQRMIAISPDWDRYLREPEAQYTHPVKGLLSLDDIYVPPSLARIQLGRETEDRTGTITRTDGVSLATEITGGGCFAVLGPPYSGKTTLAKFTYRACLKAGRVPVLLRGGDIKAGTPEQQAHRLETAYAKQYSSETLDLYRQLKPDEKVVIIDDFGLARLNVKGRGELLDRLNEFCKTVLVLTEEPPFFEQLAEGSHDGDLLTSFRYYTLQEVGHLQQEHIIRRWMSLGQENTITRQELAYQAERASRIVNTLVRNNLLPIYPFYVLVTLQTLESNERFKEEMGTYGYFYEYLIHTRMLKSSKKVSPDTKYAVLADLAFRLHTEQKNSLPENELENFGRAFVNEHLTSVRVDKLIEDMTDKTELLVYANGAYFFRYPYIRFYFVARYIRERLNDPVQGQNMRELVSKMCSEIYREEYTHVVMFLCYLSRDPLVKDELLRNAELVYPRYAWCALDEETEFLKQPGGELRTPELAARPIEESRDEHMAHLDSESESPKVEQRTEGEQLVPEEILDTNRATKTLDALGQIARNLSSSLPGAEKVRIIAACCGIGLRSMSFYLESMHLAKDALLALFEQNMREAVWRTADMRKAKGDARPTRELPPEVLKQRARQLLYAYAAWLCRIIVKRISHSAGCEELEMVYKRVLEEHYSPAMELIDLTVRLEHLPEISPDEVVTGYKKHDKHPFVQHQYRLAVVERLELFHQEEGTKQKLCTKLDIPYIQARFLSEEQKKLTS